MVRLLGWPGKILLTGSTHYNNIIAARLINLDSYIESEVHVLVERVGKLDEKLDDALCRVSTKRVDDIELNTDEMPILRAERRRIIRELSELLDIPMMNGNGMMGQVCV